MAGESSILPLELRDVWYRPRDRALLHGVTLELRPGARTVILGPNGAGKSLLLRICHGLLRPTAGEVRWRIDAPDRQAMLFQRPVLLRRSALANVAYALALRGVPRSERGPRARDVLEGVGLADVAGRAARVLSGGEQQRLALARAWALRPEVLFMDEPTASLDPAATRAIETLIEKIHSAGTKIALTTQDLGQARRLADEVVFLHRGRLLETAPAEVFFERPRTAEAAAFLQGDLVW